MACQRILILEDDPSVAAMYAAALRSPEIDVVVCTRFTDAREELKRETPEALLTDVRVGEYNGLQLAMYFRSLSPNGPVLVVSGHDDPVIGKEVARLRGEFMLKPVGLTHLRHFFSNPGAR